MSAWITDRLPTREDGDMYGLVFISIRGEVTQMSTNSIKHIGTPWQAITYPEPYVKPKVWVVNGDGVFKNGVRLSADDITKREWTTIEDALNRLEEGV